MYSASNFTVQKGLNKNKPAPVKNTCFEDLILTSSNPTGDFEEYNSAGHLIVFSHCMP